MTDYDALCARLRDFGRAYPEDMFPPVTPDERYFLHTNHPGLQDRIAGDMGRHFAKFADEAASAIAALQAVLEWALGRIQEPTLVRGQNDEHCAAYARARAALAPAPAPEVPYTEGEEYERFMQQLRKGE